MVIKVVDTVQAQFRYTRLDEGIPADDCSRFIVNFVDFFYPFLEIEDNSDLPGAPSYPPCEMFKLVLYGFYRGETSAEKLAENTEFHQIYRYVSGDISPSDRTIRRFIEKICYIF